MSKRVTFSEAGSSSSQVGSSRNSNTSALVAAYKERAAGIGWDNSAQNAKSFFGEVAEKVRTSGEQDLDTIILDLMHIQSSLDCEKVEKLQKEVKNLKSSHRERGRNARNQPDDSVELNRDNVDMKVLRTELERTKKELSDLKENLFENRFAEELSRAARISDDQTKELEQQLKICTAQRERMQRAYHDTHLELTKAKQTNRALMVKLKDTDPSVHHRLGSEHIAREISNGNNKQHEPEQEDRLKAQINETDSASKDIEAIRSIMEEILKEADSKGKHRVTAKEAQDHAERLYDCFAMSLRTMIGMNEELTATRKKHKHLSEELQTMMKRLGQLQAMVLSKGEVHN